MNDAEFAPPAGAFFIGYLGDRAVAMRGWRFTSVEVPGALRPVEIKRMYVSDDLRRRGLARRMLELLESSASAQSVSLGKRLSPGPPAPDRGFRTLHTPRYDFTPPAEGVQT